MSFFGDDEPPEPHRPFEEWHGPPKTEFGVTVAVDLLVEAVPDAALRISAIRAYSTGCEIAIRALMKGDFHAFAPGPRVGLVWPDGTKVIAEGRGERTDPPAGPVLLGYRTPHRARDPTPRVYWLWPLPPPGTLRLVADWPAAGIPETSIDFDTRALHDAGK